MAKFREYTLSTGITILLGKNAENNDELVKLYKGQSNTILHTEKPGSPFCVIVMDEPRDKDLKEAAIACAAKSQDWRDNKQDVTVHQFTGHDVKKSVFAKAGSWKLKKIPKLIKVKKIDIEQWIKKNEK